MKPVFFSQALNGIGYPRCLLPARAVDGELVELGPYLNGKSVAKATVEECWEPFAGRPSVWQIPATWAALHAMRDYRRVAGGQVIVEVDDDYTVWDRAYFRSQVELGVLDVGIGWAEGDVPEWGHPGIASPHVHRRALAEADGVIVSTSYLAGVVAGVEGARVFVCRNFVDPVDWPAASGADDGVFRVMFSASPNVQDLVLIRGAMEWAAKQDGVEALVVGYKPKWRGVRELGWIRDLAEYRETMAELRPAVWLRPVETTRFAKSKSDLKILEAAMVGALPIVTPFEPYIGWSGTPVRFASTAKDWQQEVRWAVRHRDEVREGARLVRELVLSGRGLECARSEWSRALVGSTIIRAAA